MADLRERIEAGDLSFLDGVGLLGTLASQRWFGAKSRDVLDARVVTAAIAPGGPPLLCVAIVEVRFGLQTHELFQLALGFRPQEEGWSEAIVAETGGWTAYDAMADPQLVREVVGLMRREATLSLPDASISFRNAASAEPGGSDLGKVRAMGVEQSNSSVVLDERLVLKLYRRLEAGTNPELELLRFLTDQGLPEHRAAGRMGGARGPSARCDARDPAAIRALARRRLDTGARLALVRSGLAAGAGRPPRRGHCGDCTTRSPPTRPTRASRPRSRASSPLALLSASVDEEIEQVFLAPARAGVARADRGSRRGGARSAAPALAHRAGRPGDPPPRRLPPRSGALERRRGLARPRLRGRASAIAARAAAQAIAAAGRRRDAPFVRLRLAGGAAVAGGTGAARAGRSAAGSRSSTHT